VRLTKRILLVAICSFVLSANAQTDFRFADSTAQWNICVSDYLEGPSGTWASVNISNFYVLKDTFFNNHDYQKLIQKSISEVFMRRDTMGKVFTYNKYLQKDVITYDFGANKGDTITLGSIWGNPAVDSLMTRVDSVSIYTSGGVSRKQLHLSVIGVSVIFGKTDIWIEGIGSLYSNLFNPLATERQFIPGIEFYLMNYTDNNYTDTFANSCFNTASIAEQSSIPFYVYPNPTSLTLFLKTENYKNQKVRLFDVVGREIFSTIIQDYETQIDVSQWQRGVYFYSIAKEGMSQQNGKIVLE
jgi:hypothetical protein